MGNCRSVVEALTAAGMAAAANTAAESAAPASSVTYLCRKNKIFMTRISPFPAIQSLRYPMPAAEKVYLQGRVLFSGRLKKIFRPCNNRHG